MPGFRSRRIATISLLITLAALPRADAQRAADAQQAVTIRPTELTRHGGAATDTLHEPGLKTRKGQTYVAGVGGAGIGIILGGLAGAASSSGCETTSTNEYCELGPVLLGAVIGEAVGVTVGAYAGSGGRTSLGRGFAVSLLTATAGLVVVLYTRGLALPLVPIAQTALLLALERPHAAGR